MKGKTETLNLFHVLNMLKKFRRLKSFTAVEPHKNSTLCSAFNSPWKMGSFCWTTNLS